MPEIIFLYQKDRKAYFEHVLKKYAHHIQLLFISRVRRVKPYIMLTQNSVSRHVKDILLDYVLPQLRGHDITIWPPERIHQIIDEAVNTYIADL